MENERTNPSNRLKTSKIKSEGLEHPIKQRMYRNTVNSGKPDKSTMKQHHKNLRSQQNRMSSYEKVQEHLGHNQKLKIYFQEQVIMKLKSFSSVRQLKL